MRKRLILIVTCGFAAFAYAGDSHVDDWFEARYAPLWKTSPWEKVDEIAAFYAETVADHSADGGLATVASRQWIGAGIDGWKADGWVSSTLAGLHSERLNDSTAVFKARWLDVYADGTEEHTCGWYLADLLDDGWKFTAYADLVCAEHEF